MRFLNPNVGVLGATPVRVYNLNNTPVGYLVFQVVATSTIVDIVNRRNATMSMDCLLPLRPTACQKTSLDPR